MVWIELTHILSYFSIAHNAENKNKGEEIMKKRFRSVLVILLIAALMLTGCAGQTSADNAKSTQSTEAQAPAGAPTGGKSAKDTMVIAVAGDIPSLKGAQNSRTTASLTWPTLFTLHETQTGGYEYVIDEQSIAQKAEWSDDKQTLVITLKEGVTMHNGSTLTADDVVFSIALECDTTNNLNASPNMPTDGSGVEKVDEKTVKLTFNTVSVNNWNLAAQFRVFDKESYEASGAQDLQTYGMDPAHFVSYGPYRFTEFSAGDHLSFEKFDNYFAGNDSTIQHITIRRIDESTVAMMELQTGGVDVIMYPANSDIVDVENGTYDNIKYTSAAGLYQQLVVFNLDASSLCADANVRKALCYAMNRQAMWEGAFESSGLFADTPVTRTQEFIETYDEPYPQDLEKAKQMLVDAGIPEGTTFTVCVDNDTYRTTAVEMFKNVMTGMGYQVDIKTGDNAAYLNDVLYTTDWDLEFGKSGMVGSVAYWVKSQWNLFNHGNTAKEDFTAFYAMEDEILAEFDDEARYQLTQNFMNAYVNDYCISYPIRQDVYGNLMAKDLEGFSRWGEQWNVVGAYFSK